MYRPAWRISQMGVASTGSRRQAFMKRDSFQGALVAPGFNLAIPFCGSSDHRFIDPSVDRFIG
jgi:hypothetical protein